MERLIKQWKQKLITYQSAIDASSHERDKAFHKGKKAAMEIALEELQNFVSSNPLLSDEICRFCNNPKNQHKLTLTGHTICYPT